MDFHRLTDNESPPLIQNSKIPLLARAARARGKNRKPDSKYWLTVLDFRIPDSQVEIRIRRGDVENRLINKKGKK